MGSMKPKLQARQVARAIGTGLTPADWATAIIMGTMTFALAVFEVASLRRILRRIATAIKTPELGRPKVAMTPPPMALARPVSKMALPNARPPPKSRTVPQSILTASFQVREREWGEPEGYKCERGEEGADPGAPLVEGGFVHRGRREMNGTGAESAKKTRGITGRRAEPNPSMRCKQKRASS